jgi:N-acetylmuramoyl-L-alanine amidase
VEHGAVKTAVSDTVDNDTDNDTRPVVCIDAGHGGSDCGAESDEGYEKDQTLMIAKLVQQHLQSAGVVVVMTRTSDIFIGLDERVEICNNANCDLLLSIHRNTYERDSSIRGVEAWIHSSDPDDAHEFAQDLMTELKKVSGVYDRGIKTGSMTDSEEDYRLNGNTNCTSCLLELGFMSNSADLALVTTQKEKVANAISEGILKYLRENGLM